MTNMSKCKIIQSLVGKKETLIIKFAALQGASVSA